MTADHQPDRRPGSEDGFDADLDALVRRNPAYHDTPLGRGEIAPPPMRPRPERPATPRRPDRPLGWRLLGIPAPRDLVRALVIDGYPRTAHRWAFGRVAASLAWTHAAAGVIAAGMLGWLLHALGTSPRTMLMGMFVLAVGFIVIAALQVRPIFEAIRYAARWRAEMARADAMVAAKRDRPVTEEPSASRES